MLSAADGQNVDDPKRNRKMSLKQMLARHNKFIESVKDTHTNQFLMGMAQLCHMDTSLAERVWLDFFPRIWEILSERQQGVSD